MKRLKLSSRSSTSATSSSPHSDAAMPLKQKKSKKRSLLQSPKMKKKSILPIATTAKDGPGAAKKTSDLALAVINTSSANGQFSPQRKQHGPLGCEARLDCNATSNPESRRPGPTLPTSLWCLDFFPDAFLQPIEPVAVLAATGGSGIVGSGKLPPGVSDIDAAVSQDPDWAAQSSPAYFQYVRELELEQRLCPQYVHALLSEASTSASACSGSCATSRGNVGPAQRTQRLPLRGVDRGRLVDFIVSGVWLSNISIYFSCVSEKFYAINHQVLPACYVM